jgi:branched-subunit amino acid ABC-type transport system permease component
MHLAPGLVRRLLGSRSRTATPFGRDRAGGVALIFALALIPVGLMIGAAIDYNRAIAMRTALNAAADAAALSAVTQAGMTLNQGQARKAALDFFNARAGLAKEARNIQPSVSVNASGSQRVAVVSYAAEVATGVFKLAGWSNIAIAGTATATSALPAYIDFHLLLDNTPSMGVGATPSDVAKMVANTSDTEVLRILANAAPVTGGAAGLLLRLDPRPANLQFESRAAFYWLALAFVAAALGLTAWIARSRFGSRLVALRENEEAAKALGVDPLAAKLGAVALSGGVTAAAGCLYVQYFLYLDANIGFGTWISIEALLAPTIGGAGTVLGPLVGAFALQGLSEVTKSLAGRVPGVDLAVFGALLVLVVAFAPRGLVGLWQRVARA